MNPLKTYLAFPFCEDSTGFVARLRNCGDTPRHTKNPLKGNCRVLSWQISLVLIDYPFGEKTHFLSHFDGSCWQLSLYQLAIQGKNKPFEWLGRVISFNRIFPAVSGKSAFACKKARANVYFTYERHIFKFEFLFYAI